jgi:hypothetical protein
LSIRIKMIDGTVNLKLKFFDNPHTSSAIYWSQILLIVEEKPWVFKLV